MQLRKRAALTAPFLISMGFTALAQNQVTGNEFNPAISLILDWHNASYSLDPEGYRLAGFQLDAEAGLPSEGLSLDETELAMSANVDDKFYGFLTAALEQTDDETSIAVEEAYFETLALPKGLKIKAGQFLSDVGYLNPIHAHAWDFNDAPLAYVAMLNSGYKDAGVQLIWVAPSTLFIQLGTELLRGDSFPAAGGAASGSLARLALGEVEVVVGPSGEAVADEGAVFTGVAVAVEDRRVLAPAGAEEEEQAETPHAAE